MPLEYQQELAGEDPAKETEVPGQTEKKEAVIGYRVSGGWIPLDRTDT
jgi:hypothetical protein